MIPTGQAREGGQCVHLKIIIPLSLALSHGGERGRTIQVFCRYQGLEEDRIHGETIHILPTQTKWVPSPRWRERARVRGKIISIIQLQPVEPIAKLGKIVTPAKAGVQKCLKILDTGIRRYDTGGVLLLARYFSIKHLVT
jgi:hypothetical protein